jgi:hypothetical protein
MHSRGWCKLHWTRWWRHGDPQSTLQAPDYKGTPCQVQDCGRTATRRGLCNMHYSRWLKHGDPLTLMNTRLPDKCLVEGCDSQPRGKGYCHNHYYRLRFYGDPLAQTPKRRALPKLIRLRREDRKDGRIPRWMRRVWFQWSLAPAPSDPVV